ncbi:hypothetical protein [Pseudomonas brenneri]
MFDYAKLFRGTIDDFTRVPARSHQGGATRNAAEVILVHHNHPIRTPPPVGQQIAMARHAK